MAESDNEIEYDSDGNIDNNQIYLDIRHDGPIMGALWDKKLGKWVHCGNKRKRFDDTTNDDPHTNLLINPKKKAKFYMKVEQAEIENLSNNLKKFKPPRNMNTIALLHASKLSNNNNNKNDGTNMTEYPELLNKDIKTVLNSANNFKLPNKFDDLNISQYTKHALKIHGFKYLTDIQKVSLPHSLGGRDILGCAITGSGKTLSFVIPLIENLYRKAWNNTLGLGGLILTPTRELALQIFNTIKLIGIQRIKHLNCGLIVGGKHSSFKDEYGMLHRMTIICGTPGRILNHFEKNDLLIFNQLQILILDEADMMLDIGLLNQVKKIIDYLPKKRQTLMFSATLTMDIIKFSKVSLKKPVYLPLHSIHNSPKNLLHTYVETPIEHKYNLLWSFIQTHINHKIIIFFACLRQVKYTRRIFSKLRPYCGIYCLHSEMRQFGRMSMYKAFKNKKNRAMLLCTEIASRGLDFRNVDWVINFDVPNNIKTYVHRVGRCARLGQKGNSITFLSESELKFVDELKKLNINIKKLGIKTKNLKPILGSFRSILVKDKKMLELAQKCFNSYLAFYYLHGNPNYMDPNKLDKEKLAFMFGLTFIPKYKSFLKKAKARKLDDIPIELKNILLDTKVKRKQKSELQEAGLIDKDIMDENENNENNDNNKLNENDLNEFLENELKDDNSDDNDDDLYMNNSDNNSDNDLEANAIDAILSRE